MDHYLNSASRYHRYLFAQLLPVFVRKDPATAIAAADQFARLGTERIFGEGALEVERRAVENEIAARHDWEPGEQPLANRKHLLHE